MSVVIPDPYDAYLRDPNVLVDPYEALLTPAELEQEAAVKGGHGVVKAAVGLGAAYLVYRTYMSRRLKKEVAGSGNTVTYKALHLAAGTAFNVFMPRWVTMTAPYLLAGYVEGMQDVQQGTVPLEILTGIAQDYAQDLGTHINDVSAEAMLSGFQAQVNRKVPPIMAAQRIADAYGVTPRTMNTLVNVWTGEDPKNVTDQVLPSAKADRANAIIAAQNNLRARQIGDNEAWAARTQGKQIVWMYGVQNGVIPSDARRMWITAGDEKVCPVCGPMHRVTSLVSEKFSIKGGEVWTPPAHVNCRCDIALDLADELTEELSELLDQESVSKAQGRDRYDRDRTGRFARQESRGYKEREAEVDEMLAQVNRALTIPAPVEQVETTPQPREKLGRATLGGSKLGGSTIGSSTKLGETTRAPLGRASLSSTEQERSEATAREQMQRPKMVRERTPLKAKANPKLARPPRTILKNEPIKDENGETWMPLGFSLAAVVTKKKYEELSHKGVFEADKTMEFYEKHSHADTDSEGNSLNSAISRHWDAVINKAADDFYEKPGKSTYTDPRSQRKFVIDAEAYSLAMDALLSGMSYRDGNMQENKIELQGQGHYADDIALANPIELAEILELDEVIQDNIPIVIETAHGHPGSTDKAPWARPDVWNNPGRWREVDWELDENIDVNGMPYMRVETEPERFQESS